MQQVAKVVSIKENGQAVVEVKRPSACGHDCESCAGSCTAAQEYVRASADNPLGAREGDTVLIQARTGEVLKGAAVFYLLPVVLFIVILTAAAPLGEGASAVLALAGAGVAFAGVWLYSRRLKAKQGISMEIIKIL